VCGHSNVQMLTRGTSPPILKLWDTQGYLWLPYDLMEVIKLIGEIFRPKTFFFQKNTLCHSFRISGIPSVLLSFLPDYCHSFHISVIPSELFRELQILTSSKSFPYPKGEKNGHLRWPYMQVIIILSLVKS
jgi:hypothetical protein